jgi:hypothetical protein
MPVLDLQIVSASLAALRAATLAVALPGPRAVPANHTPLTAVASLAELGVVSLAGLAAALARSAALVLSSSRPGALDQAMSLTDGWYERGSTARGKADFPLFLRSRVRWH